MKTTMTKPEWMLSGNAIARRMYREVSEKRGLRGHVYTLHTESVFAIENIRLGYPEIAATNIRRAKRALVRLQRSEELAPAGFEKALQAFLAASAAAR